MSQTERIVVVGAGLAGLRAGERLRELGFNGELMIIGDETLPPYHRPALSKQLLTGAMRPNDLMLPAYRDIGAKWRLGTPAGYLVPRNRVVRLPGGEEITYDGLVIATGVEARRPNGVPYDDPRVLVMRTLPDALALERAIASSRGPIAVVGGGFTGCEIAASLRHMGREVTIIGRAPSLLGNVLGPTLGDWLTNLHRGHGVDLALETKVEQWKPGQDGITLNLSDGTSMLASCVVIAAGTEPSTTWLRGSGLPLDNGVVCEATCHVVGAEDVVAAGDVAQWPNIRFDEVPRRIEHWLNAVEMGRAAAESLLAGRANAEPFTPMPRFWTEQYGVRIMAAGVPKLGTDTITLGTPDDGTGTVVGYIRDGRLMGVVGVDCPSSVLTWTESVCQQNPIPRRHGQPAWEHDEASPLADEPAAPATRKGIGRHSLPTAKRKGFRKDDKSSQTGGRLRALGTGGRLRPVDPPSRSSDSGGRPRPVEQPNRLNATDSSARLRPATANRLRPAESSARLSPVDDGSRFGPADSNSRMGPAGTSGRMAPVNGRSGPAESNGRLRPVDQPNPNGRPAAGPAGPLGTNGRMVPVNGHANGNSGPVRTNGRMVPVGGHANGHAGPVGTNGRIVPVNGGAVNGHAGGPAGPQGTNGRMVPVDGRVNGHAGPVGTNGRIVPVNGGAVNGHGGPGTNGRMVPAGGRVNGHAGPVGTNGRIVPVNGGAVNGHAGGPAGPQGTNGRMVPVNGGAMNGHGGPGTNGRMVPVDGRVNGHAGPVGTNGRIVPVNGGAVNGHAGGPVGPQGTNGRMVPVNGRNTNGHGVNRSAVNGRGPNGHSGPVGTNSRMVPVDGRGPDGPSGPQGTVGRLVPLDVTSAIPVLDAKGHVVNGFGANGHTGPAATNGHAVNGRATNGRAVTSPATNGHSGHSGHSAHTNGHEPSAAPGTNGRGANGHPGTQGGTRAAERWGDDMDATGWVRRVDPNKRWTEDEANGRPVDTNGRIRPVDINGRLRPLEYLNRDW